MNCSRVLLTRSGFRFQNPSESRPQRQCRHAVSSTDTMLLPLLYIYALLFVFKFLFCRFEPVKPPNSLWHGTATQFCAAIKADGLKKMSRQHVHLSSDRATATAVGSRHGPAVVLGVDAARMHADGFQFFCSENGVWLTDHVPQQYLSGFPRVDTAAADANDNPRRTRSPSPCGGGGAVRL